MKPCHLLPLVVALALPLSAAEEGKPSTPPAPKNAVPSKIRAPSPKPNGHEKWIGAMTMPVPEMVRAQLPHLPEGLGAAVVMVMKESPAMAAGLERFDIIVRADGQPVSSQKDLQEIINKRTFGTQARLEVIRKGAPKQLYVIVLERPEGEPAGGGGPGSRGGVFGSNMRPENVSIQFSYTDTNGKQQTVGAPSLAAFGQKAKEDEAFRNQVQQMFQGLQQNPQGITIRLKPVQNTPASPPQAP